VQFCERARARARVCVCVCVCVLKMFYYQFLTQTQLVLWIIDMILNLIRKTKAEERG